MWDKSQLSRFHWAYHQISTFEHHITECTSEFETDPTIMSAENERKARGIRHLLQSLTPAHCDMLILLANKQLESGVGLSFKQWFEECLFGMLVNNDVKFRQMCGEMIDHQCVQEYSSETGEDCFRVPYSDEVIQTEIIESDIIHRN